jgi:ABC-2 type transport system ATP-binding protein
VADSVISVRGLRKSYDGFEAVRGIDLEVGSGEVFAFLGPNGAGKTTTIECCEGLRRPDAGTVRVLGLDPDRDGARLRPRVGVQLQDGGLPAGARAGEVLQHVAALHAHPVESARLAAELGLEPVLGTTVRRLSGGERRRLALALAVVGRPEIVFLDEPTAGLDVESRHEVWRELEAYAAAGHTILLTTHYLEEAEELASRVVLLTRGCIVAEGSPAELAARVNADGLEEAFLLMTEAGR